MRIARCFFGSCDNWNFNTSNPCVHVGGNYNQNLNYGLFHVNYNSTSNANSLIGSRVLRRRQPKMYQCMTCRTPLGEDLPYRHGMVALANDREAKRRDILEKSKQSF